MESGIPLGINLFDRVVCREAVAERQESLSGVRSGYDGGRSFPDRFWSTIAPTFFDIASQGNCLTK
jgi:hypothetical protein